MKRRIKRAQSIIAAMEQTPSWMVDNLNLKSGYRVNYKFRDTLKSVFQKHNDLLNIWIHFLGAIFFLVLIFYLISHRNESINIYKELKQDFT